MNILMVQGLAQWRRGHILGKIPIIFSIQKKSQIIENVPDKGTF